VQKAVLYWRFVRYILKELAKKQDRIAQNRLGLHKYCRTLYTYFFIKVTSEFSQILQSCILSIPASFQGAAGGHIYSYVFVLGAQINDTASYKTAYYSMCDL